MESKFTLRKMIFSLKEVYNTYSDDNMISDEHIAYLIDQMRADLIFRNYINKNTEVPDNLYTPIVLKMQSDGDCNDCNTDMFILKSKEQFPKTLNFTNRKLIKDLKIGGLFFKYLNYIENNRLPYLTAGKFFSTQYYYTIDTDNHLLLISFGKPLLITEIKMRVVPEDFNGIGDFLDSDNCDPLDFPYPVDSTIAELIRVNLEQIAMTKLKVPIDKVNDAEYEIVGGMPSSQYYRNKNRYNNELQSSDEESSANQNRLRRQQQAELELQQSQQEQE